MKPEKEHLIRDLLDENSAREATLLAGAQILRRRRHWRTAQRVTAVLALITVVMGLALRKETRSSPRLAVAMPPAPPATEVHEMNDEELLALFPNTPVALASLPDGKKRLLFPRPGDEQRYINRL